MDFFNKFGCDEVWVCMMKYWFLVVVVWSNFWYIFGILREFKIRVFRVGDNR